MWLEGDNSSNSTDSRVYGAVPQAMLKGRVWLKLWPLTGQLIRFTVPYHSVNTHVATSSMPMDVMYQMLSKVWYVKCVHFSRSNARTDVYELYQPVSTE